MPNKIFTRIKIVNRIAEEERARPVEQDLLDVVMFATEKLLSRRRRTTKTQDEQSGIL